MLLSWVQLIQGEPQWTKKKINIPAHARIRLILFYQVTLKATRSELPACCFIRFANLIFIRLLSLIWSTYDPTQRASQPNGTMFLPRWKCISLSTLYPCFIIKSIMLAYVENAQINEIPCQVFTATLHPDIFSHNTYTQLVVDCLYGFSGCRLVSHPIILGFKILVVNPPHG